MLWTGVLVLASSCALPDSDGADQSAPSAKLLTSTSPSSEQKASTPSSTPLPTNDPTTTATTSPTTVSPPPQGIRFRQKISPVGPPPLPPAVPQPNPTAHFDIGAGWEGNAELTTVSCSAHTEARDAYRGWEFVASNPKGDRLNIKLFSKWADKYGPRRPQYGPEVTIGFVDDDGRHWETHSSWALMRDEPGPTIDLNADRGTITFSGVGLTVPIARTDIDNKSTYVTFAGILTCPVPPPDIP